MGCTQTKREILRSGSGKLYNRKIRKQRKFRSGLHVEKTSEMGAEANFQAAYTTDTDEEYSKVNGNSHGYSNNGYNNIPKVIDLVAQGVSCEIQTDPVSQDVKHNNTNNEK